MICDCHIYLYEEHDPLASSATFRPPVAPVSACRAVRQALWLHRAILVQPTGDGFDNRCLLDGLDQLGPDMPDPAVRQKILVGNPAQLCGV